MAKPAVVLLSGGMDSATVLAMAKAQGFTCYALSFRYGNAIPLNYRQQLIKLSCKVRCAMKSLIWIYHALVVPL